MLFMCNSVAKLHRGLRHSQVGHQVALLSHGILWHLDVSTVEFGSQDVAGQQQSLRKVVAVWAPGSYR